MITYEDIKKANETIKTTDIKGKEYAEVNQRIKAFRMVHPNGSIITELAKLENGICIITAKVSDENGNILGTGTAYEKENSTFINKTSYIENCETSAVGRALGMCGYGIDTSVRSAEEQENAEFQQEIDKPIDETKVKALKQAIENANISDSNVTSILNEFKYKEIEEITNRYYGDIVNKLRALKED